MGHTGLRKLTRCVLDDGSPSSFIAKISIYELKLEKVDCRDIEVSAFEPRSSDSGPIRVARFGAKSIWGNTTVPITALECTQALCPHPHGPSHCFYGADSQNTNSRPDRRRTRPPHRGRHGMGLLCFYNTPIFITGFTAYKVWLDFDWNSNGHYC